ncbi:hypothetical protein ACT3UD_06365 [Glutamicibacter sp. 287]|uniref:hypothetical protein n=1 Tax=unclassified Glutamicibacter TaxID=2627139 RepID=UPI000BB6CFC5|nr:hypothetical protein [Glutamicibacter sp. BW80]PCC28283.1 hypothetical protein CIK76_12750 [Glutamicibacter sp. BW80]
MFYKSPSARRSLALASTAVVAGLMLSGCGQASTSGEGTTEPTGSENVVDQNALLETNDALSATLGEDYVQGWIEDGKLNVSTTDESQMKAIEEAGAQPHLVEYSADDLRQAIKDVMKWQAGLESPLNVSIHGYTLNPKIGGLTLSVDSSHLEEIKTLLETEKPLGGVPVEFQKSGGIATRAN